MLVAILQTFLMRLFAGLLALPVQYGDRLELT